MSSLLNKKILDATLPVILYELTPPMALSEAKSLQAYVNCAVDLFQNVSVPIDAVNIPEIRDETPTAQEGERIESYVPKVDTGHFSDLLRESSKNDIDVIINHCTVYEPWDEQKLWLKRVIEDHNINSVILVGGSSSQIAYPGPSVIEMNHFIQANHPTDLLCGGITIQNRRYDDLVRDEPYRLLEKTKAGFNFFTSQVIYNAESVMSLLKDYNSLCQQENLAPKRIFLSFSPISTLKDLMFLRWLGVDIPDGIEAILFETNLGVGWRSVKVSLKIFQDILNFIDMEGITVPIGINVEHINRHNFELTKELIENLGGAYLDFCRTSRLPFKVHMEEPKFI